MATIYSQLSRGSKGSDVKTLQELLNQNGYSLDVDGVFGPDTQAAVKDYQTKNKLAVDGIAGNETWGALTGGTSSTGSTSQAGAADMSFSYDDYKQSDTVQQAYALLQQQMGNKPGAYNSQWADQITGLIDQIINRKDFSYDLNGDALYQQYKDQYITQGKMAMMDTMGQAQAMTGGYGNSYAQSVGQQAYHAYLQKLNEVVPELYAMALDQYNQEGQDMLNQYSLLAAQDEADYGRYRDEVSDYYTQLQQLQDTYYTERDFDYGKWTDGRDFAYGQYADDRAYAYQQERDQVADEQWQKEYEESVRRWNQENGISSGGSGGSEGSDDTGGSDGPNVSDGPGGVGYDNGTVSEANVKKIQQALGVTADGKWGPASQAAAQAKWGVTSANAAWDALIPDHTPETAIKPGVFTGSTYSEAVDYMKKNGVSAAEASAVMTQSEWQRRKASLQSYGTGGAEVKNYSSYKEYLADYVEYQMSKK